MLSRRLSRPRAALVVAVAAALAATVAVTPSFAGSFLTSQKAAHLYVTSKKVNAVFLKKKAAENTFVKKADVPLTPTAAIAAGTAPFEASATTAGYIPNAFAAFSTKDVAPAVITFTGQALCFAEKPSAELACPIQILVDGQPTGKINLAPSTATAPKAAPIAQTVMQTTVLNKGGHTVAVQYAGAAKVHFILKGWNLAVQTYPETLEPLEAPSGKPGKVG